MADPDYGWKFAQCFGDKGEVEEVSEGWEYCFVNEAGMNQP